MGEPFSRGLLAGADRVAAIRRFNRFYTRWIGVLQEGLPRSQFSPAETRVPYELAHRSDATATALASRAPPATGG